MAFKDRLTELRSENGFSMSESAQLVGVAPSTWSHWEKEDGLPRSKQIFKIAEAFGVTTKWLETGLGEKTPEKEEEKAEEIKVQKLESSRTIYSKESEEKLRDIETMIAFLKELDVPRERKRHIHRTLCGYRTELENVVLFGEVR